MKKRLVAATAILALLLVPSAAFAADATPDDYAPATEENNHASTWETGDLECEKIEGFGESDYTWVADQDYALVVVKAGSEETGNNTIFEDVLDGETVFADTNENGISDPGGPEGDKSISHVIVCNPEEEPTPSPTPTEEATPTPSPSPTPTLPTDATPTPTLPDQSTPTPTAPGETPTATSTLPASDTDDSSGSGGGPLPLLLILLAAGAAATVVLSTKKGTR